MTGDTEQYYPVVLFITLYKVVLTFESVDEILTCDHSNESDIPAVLFIMLYKMFLTFACIHNPLLSISIIFVEACTILYKPPLNE